MRENDVEEKSCNLHKRMKEKVKVNIVKKRTSHAFMTSGAKNMTAEKLENGEK